MIPRISALLAVLLGLCLAPLPALADRGQEGNDPIKEFKQYFKKHKDIPTRVEAVIALRGIDSPALVEALLPLLQDPEPEIVNAATSVLIEVKAPETITVLGTALQETASADVRVQLLDVFRRGKLPCELALLQPALDDNDWRVRWKCVLAIVDRGEPDAAAVGPLVKDREPAVRMAVIDGLRALKSKDVVAPAIAALSDDVWQVRSAAIAALRDVRHQDSFGPLVLLLQEEEGRLAEEILIALENLTYYDAGPDPKSWLGYWESVKANWMLPMVDMRGRRAVTGAGGEVADTGTRVAKPVEYQGIETPSRRIIFVIDVSGSMEALVIDRDRFKDGGYPSMVRMDIVKTELMRTLERLESYVEFTILSFATDLRPWKKALVPATASNKTAAINWVKSLKPLGGNEDAALAGVGLVGAANVEAGKTNTYGALMWALNVEEAGLVTQGYETAVDTVFFLSDGRPTHGRYVQTDDILREVLFANELRRIVLHTIAIGDFDKSFMRRLAEENGGLYVDLGR